MAANPVRQGAAREFTRKACPIWISPASRCRMARPLDGAQRAENRAFLKWLRKTGNVRLACREIGVAYGTMQHRRRRHPAFAARWEAHLAAAQAEFHRTGLKAPKAKAAARARSPLRTEGGELVVVRRNDGRLQM